MQYIDLEVTVGNIDITLTCGVSEGCVEEVTGYVNGVENPRLRRWANRYVDSDEGRDRIADACADEGVKLWDGRPW